jgi:hypothetical protein
MTEPIDPNPPDLYLQPGYPVPWPVEPAQPQWQAAPPAQRRARPSRSTILICCLVLAAVGVGVYYLVHKPYRPDPLPIPIAFDAYTQIESADTDRLESMVRSTPGGASATVGFYSRNSGDIPRLIVFVFPAEVFPDGVDQAADTIRSDIGAGAAQLTPYPAGPRGGNSRCGPLDFASTPAQMCAWADATSAGVMVSVVTPMTPARLARIEQNFRSRLP